VGETPPPSASNPSGSSSGSDSGPPSWSGVGQTPPPSASNPLGLGSGLGGAERPPFRCPYSTS